MRENWFWVSPSMGRLYPRQKSASTGNFWLFSGGVRRGYDALEQAGNGPGVLCKQQGAVRAAERRLAGALSTREPARGWGRLSIREHVLVVGCRVHVVARFVGVGARPIRRRRSGRRVVPGAEVAEEVTGWRLQAGDWSYLLLRSERIKPLRTFEVSTVRADSCRCDCSGRKPRRTASPTWYSTSRAEP